MSFSPLEAATAVACGVLLVLGLARLGRIRRGRKPTGPSGLRVRLADVDQAPDDLYPQVPCSGTLVRRLPGPDRPDYWIARLDAPLRWTDAGTEHRIEHLVLAARLQGQTIDRAFDRLTVGIAYVVDATLVADASLTFEKVRYVAIGTVERV